MLVCLPIFPVEWVLYRRSGTFSVSYFELSSCGKNRKNRS